MPRAERVDLRGLSTHVMHWGDESAPKLFMLHGWMDVGASFQFVVDALQARWHVIAPDLRGFGRSDWQPQGYWFADYVADLDALLARFSPNEPANLIGHSLGAHVVMHYAGVRRSRVATLVALDGFGIPAESADRAPYKFTRWLDALEQPVAFSPYDSFDAVAQRLLKNDPRLTRDKAAFLARHWAAESTDGKVRLTSDPRHKLPFPTVYRIEEVYAIWRRITARTLWVAARDSHIRAWLDHRSPEEVLDKPLAEIRLRMAHILDATLFEIPDAGHMLHHDQPEAVAHAIERFNKNLRVDQVPRR
ncbi:MAG TPA: alpha/beta hydrolase [Casimicrobiaceae bacterium]|nr:alpha/beta hydrolase [Casimicrobiaceae bacterium]